MIQTYEPIRGMIICKSGGSYVLTSDHMEEIAKKDEEIEKLRREADGIILACHRAFGDSSDFVKQEAKRLANKWVNKEAKCL